jgi:hypothetical protein
VGTSFPCTAARRLMDPLQHRLASIALEIAGSRGFVLGGGHAVELHGMGTRPSEDIDLFSNLRGGPERWPTR